MVSAKEIEDLELSEMDSREIEIEDLKEVSEMNSREIIVFKEISHMIDEAFAVLENRMDMLDKKIDDIEKSLIKKGFHSLSLDIQRIIRKHSDAITR